MSQENVKLVLRLFESFNESGEPDYSVMDPAIRATAVRGWPEAGPFLGRAAVIRESQRLLDWGENRFTDMSVVADEGDWVVIAFRWQVRAAGSGIETEFDVAIAIRVKEGRITEWHNRWSREEALEAAGLSEQAMSQENVEIVRKYLNAINAFMRDELTREAFEELLDPQVEVHGVEGVQGIPGLSPHVRGISAKMEIWGQFRSAWVDPVIEPLEITEAPEDRVLTLVSHSGRGRESGVPIKYHFFLVFTIRDGRVCKEEFFGHRANALEAAGLSE